MGISLFPRKGVSMKIIKSDFGLTGAGESAHIYHLENASGAYVEITDFGARLVRLAVPDRNGHLTDVCLGFDTISSYEKDTASLGAVCGRVANRIKNGRFSLHGKNYQLAVNNGQTTCTAVLSAMVPGSGRQKRQRTDWFSPCTLPTVMRDIPEI